MVLDTASLQGTDSDHVLGLFKSGNMSLEWAGDQAQPFPGSGFPNGQTWAENQRPANEPSLADMTAKAIDLLDDSNGRHGRGRGFFLQVEGASIDKQDHVERPCEQIGETLGRPGTLSTLLTKGDRSLMTVNYGTRPHGQSQDHAGTEVRIVAQGRRPRT